MKLNKPSTDTWSALTGGTRPPGGLGRCARRLTRPEAAFHPSQQHRCGFVSIMLGLLCLPLTILAAEPPAPVLFADDFAHGLAQWSVEQMPDGSVTAQNGVLRIADAGGATVWFRSRLDAPVEISYEATVVMQGGPHDRLSDLNCFWMAQDPTQPAGALPAGRSGKFSDYDNLLTYYVGYGGNNNTTTRFRRYDGTGERPLLPAHDRRDAASLLIANHPYQIKIVVRDGTTEYWRDGERLFSHHDPQPLTSGYFAFRTVRSHLVIGNFTVKSAPPAPHNR